MLVVGGKEINYSVFFATRASAELYDPATEKWTQTGSLKYDRHSHTATLLQDGRVLVAGGRDNLASGATAEIYDPTTGKWTQTGSLKYDRYGHTATLLQNGKVLIVAGWQLLRADYSSISSILGSAELYDPNTGTWTQTVPLNYARLDHTATLLHDGRVLVAGGDGGDSILATAEIYDPATGVWTQTRSLSYGRDTHTATLLDYGAVLVTGGSDGGTIRTSTEWFFPGR